MEPDRLHLLMLVGGFVAALVVIAFPVSIGRALTVRHWRRLAAILGGEYRPPTRRDSPGSIVVPRGPGPVLIRQVGAVGRRCHTLLTGESLLATGFTLQICRRGWNWYLRHAEQLEASLLGGPDDEWVLELHTDDVTLAREWVDLELLSRLRRAQPLAHVFVLGGGRLWVATVTDWERAPDRLVPVLEAMDAILARGAELAARWDRLGAELGAEVTVPWTPAGAVLELSLGAVSVRVTHERETRGSEWRSCLVTVVEAEDARRATESYEIVFGDLYVANSALDEVDVDPDSAGLGVSVRSDAPDQTKARLSRSLLERLAGAGVAAVYVESGAAMAIVPSAVGKPEAVRALIDLTTPLCAPNPLGPYR